MTRRPRLPALTIRTRLTLMYGMLFLLGGSVLIGAMVLSVRGSTFSPVPRQVVREVLADSGLDDEEPDAGSGQSGGLDRHEREERLERGLREQLREKAMHRLVRGSLLLLGGLGVLSVGAGWFVAGRTLSRLRHITDAARRAGEDTLHERLNLPGPRDEIKELGDTFDGMLARLDAAFDTQRRFVANASHELRTPLAVTRAAVEVTLSRPNPTVEQLRAMGEDVRVSTARAERLIDSLLTLARSEQELSRSGVDDLADLAAEALDVVRRDAAGRGLRVSEELVPAPVCGDVALLARAVGNLVENAVRHNVDGGALRVVTRVDGGMSVLEVDNDGPVVDPEGVHRLFEPFHRGERTRLDGVGAGLGLSIVRAVAGSHHGVVTAAARPEGGLRVTLVLPRPAG